MDLFTSGVFKLRALFMNILSTTSLIRWRGELNFNRMSCFACASPPVTTGDRNSCMLFEFAFITAGWNQFTTCDIRGISARLTGTGSPSPGFTLFASMSLSLLFLMVKYSSACGFPIRSASTLSMRRIWHISSSVFPSVANTRICLTFSRFCIAASSLV